MARSDHETTLARQWELLRNHLPSRRPGRSSREIRDRLEAAGHKVSKRTVERDLDELSRIFPLRKNDISIPFGWHWIENARFDLPGMGLAEAVSLGLMEDVLRQMMPPQFLTALESKFSLAREKLSALPKIPHAKWSDLVRYVPPGLTFFPPFLAAEILPTIQEALLQQKQLAVVYQGGVTDIEKELILHPLSLIQQGVRSYLLATTFNYDTPLLYAVHRMDSVKPINAKSNRPKRFSLDQFLADGGAQFGSGKTITLKAQVSDELARLLQETAISTDQKITTHRDKHTLTATVRESWQLLFWIRSQGASITILKPSSIKNAIIAELESALSLYQK